MSESEFKEGDKVSLGVITGDVVLDAVVDGFYKEFVVINFQGANGFYLSVTKPEYAGKPGDWFLSKMLVHPSNLRHRDK